MGSSVDILVVVENKGTTKYVEFNNSFWMSAHVPEMVCTVLHYFNG